MSTPSSESEWGVLARLLLLLLLVLLLRRSVSSKRFDNHKRCSTHWQVFL